MTHYPDLFGYVAPSSMVPNETIENDMVLKIDRAIRLLKSYNSFANLKLAYSGGKDSDIILRLAQLAHIQPDIVHNSTTIDPPGTLSYCISRGARINRPQTSFFHLVQKKGLPSMFRRFCCNKLKEQYIGKYLILGIRKEESRKRDERYVEPTMCRLYTKKNSTEQIFPILNWTLNDIMDFTQMENMKYNSIYYVNGIFDPTKRLGCIGCPLTSDRGRSDYLKYPGFLRQLAKSYSKYVATHQAITSVYHDIVWQLFYSNHGDAKYQQTFHGIFQAPDPKQFLENYFHTQLP